MNDDDLQRMNTEVYARIEERMRDSERLALMSPEDLLNDCRRFFDDRRYAMHTLRVQTMIRATHEENVAPELRALYEADNVRTGEILMRCHQYWRGTCIPQIQLTFSIHRLSSFLRYYRLCSPNGGRPDHSSDGASAIFRIHIRFREQKMRVLFQRDGAQTYDENLQRLVRQIMDLTDWVAFANEAPDNWHLYLDPECALQEMTMLRRNLRMAFCAVLVERDQAVWGCVTSGPQKSRLALLSTDLVHKVIRHANNNAKD
jgi:hypothetical protein